MKSKKLKQQNLRRLEKNQQRKEQKNQLII